MAPKSHEKKRVRIKDGHEASYIESRRSSRLREGRPRRRSRSRSSRVSSLAGGPGSLGIGKTHRPSVAELVYQVLERASNRGVLKRQKSNATSQFRKVQRRRYSKHLKPQPAPRRLVPEPTGPVDRLIGQLSCKLSSLQGEESMYRRICEVLSLGSVLGFLVPSDASGKVFQICPSIWSSQELPTKQNSMET
ncbi:hypothetical protein QAD02_020086 [Eretmocerus hayati]|uniref:Uncharacterized protein n=1 Tax=Eretmocerus hayati TaxID=131215 RepID=A0ACC2PL55_9HYME|nr:hypothetical protein QAD02_020086 [Eretmocerus hayati]